jgi:hypothetical protein
VTALLPVTSVQRVAGTEPSKPPSWAVFSFTGMKTTTRGTRSQEDPSFSLAKHSLIKSSQPLVMIRIVENEYNYQYPVSKNHP